MTPSVFDPPPSRAGKRDRLQITAPLAASRPPSVRSNRDDLRRQQYVSERNGDIDLVKALG